MKKQKEKIILTKHSVIIESELNHSVIGKTYMGEIYPRWLFGIEGREKG